MVQYEKYFRDGHPYNYDLTAEEIEQCYGLLKLFRYIFVDAGLIKVDSNIVINPIFGKNTSMAGGADGDLIIDDVLYDFKSTKRLYLESKSLQQLWGYYLLNLLSGRQYNIEHLALYYSRFGAIAFTSVREVNRAELSEFEHLLKKTRVK